MNFLKIKKKLKKNKFKKNLQKQNKISSLKYLIFNIFYFI